MRKTKATLKNVQMKVQLSRIKTNSPPPPTYTVFILIWLLLDEVINKQVIAKAPLLPTPLEFPFEKIEQLLCATLSKFIKLLSSALSGYQI